MTIPAHLMRYANSALEERAVVQFDPTDFDIETLQQWHHIGVRGVRVNLVSVGKTVDIAELTATLQQYADVISPLDWALQLYIPLKMSEDLENLVPKLGVKVCLDHFEIPSLSAPHKEHYFLAGWGKKEEISTRIWMMTMTMLCLM